MKLNDQERLAIGDELANSLEPILTRAIQVAVEQALLALPGVVQSLVIQVAGVKTKVTNFYNSYPEFKGYEAIVASSIEEVESANPGLAMEEILSRAAKVAQKKLNSMKQLSAASKAKPTLDQLDYLSTMIEDAKL